MLVSYRRITTAIVSVSLYALCVMSMLVTVHSECVTVCIYAGRMEVLGCSMRYDFKSIYFLKHVASPLICNLQVLTHLREKLDHEENEQKKKLETISSLDDRVGRMRTLVSSTRFDSDKLIHEQDQAQTRQQFANNTLLLQDFESRKLYIEELKIKLNMLQEDFHRMQQKVRSAGKTSFATAYMPMNSAASSHSNRSRTFNRPRHASKNSSGSMLLLPMNSPLPGLLPIFKPKSMKSKPIK